MPPSQTWGRTSTARETVGKRNKNVIIVRKTMFIGPVGHKIKPRRLRAQLVEGTLNTLRVCFFAQVELAGHAQGTTQSTPMDPKIEKPKAAVSVSEPCTIHENPPSDCESLVYWDSEQYPDNPLNWPGGKKWAITGTLSLMCFLA